MYSGLFRSSARVGTGVIESVFKEFQKSESYVGDEEPRLSDGDLADSSSSSSSSDSD